MSKHIDLLIEYSKATVQENNNEERLTLSEAIDKTLINIRNITLNTYVYIGSNE